MHNVLRHDVLQSGTACQCQCVVQLVVQYLKNVLSASHAVNSQSPEYGSTDKYPACTHCQSFENIGPGSEATVHIDLTLLTHCLHNGRQSVDLSKRQVV